MSDVCFHVDSFSIDEISIGVLANFREFRSAINWDGAVAKMPAEVEGPCEPSLVVLPDGKTLLSVFRLQSNKNL